MKRDEKAEAKKVIITAAVVGSRTSRSQNPNVPISPEEIAKSAIECAGEGAAICHIHVRNPQTEHYSMELKLYREVVVRIRDHSDMLINLTTGPGGRFSYSKEKGWDISELASPEERVKHVLELRPELCSLDVGSVNFADSAFINLASHVEQMAQMIREAKVKPELEIFDAGHLRFAAHLTKTGLIVEPPLFQLCLGVPWGMEATLDNLLNLRSHLPQNAVWHGLGVGSAQFPIASAAVLAGGHVRVGFEDNVYLARNVLAKSNGSLVRKAAEIVRVLNREVASTSEARMILGLGQC